MANRIPCWILISDRALVICIIGAAEYLPRIVRASLPLSSEDNREHLIVAMDSDAAEKIPKLEYAFLLENSRLL